MSTPSSPIVILDSGLGGLTVVRAVRQALPHEDILYFGDTARVPYGSKSAELVTRYTSQIIEFFEPHHPKHVVLACNTATALSLRALRERFAHLSISGVIEPGARAAVEAAGQKPSPIIGVIGTEATIRSRAYEHAIARRRQMARMICRAAPLLAPIIEEGRGDDDPLVQLALRQYIAPMVERRMDVLVLGCTHYPVYRDAIETLCGAGISVIDSAGKCAEDVVRRLSGCGLLKPAQDRPGALRCFVTDDAGRFGRLAQRFLGIEVDEAQAVSVESLYVPAAVAKSA